MIRCAAFSVSLSERAAKVAALSAETIDRKRTEVSRLEFGRSETSVLSPAIDVLQLGCGAGFPILHGFSEGSGGEYSMVTENEGLLEVARDFAGTRPLYVADSGEWLASDHRFFRSEACSLLPPGSRREVMGGVTQRASSYSEEYSGDFDEAAREVASAVEKSVKDRAVGTRKVCVAFSGGLDSSILARCASKFTKVIAVSAYAPGSLDMTKARTAAVALGLEFEACELEKPKVASELAALDLPFPPSSMDRSLWCIYSVTSRRAAELGADLIMLGQMADELFGGYAKYEKAARTGGLDAAKRLMSEDVMGCAVRGFIRDEAACSRWLEPRFPFAEESLMKLGLSLPTSFKLIGGERKAVLREAARLLGVPEGLSDSPKKAAQYSSGVSKLV